MTDTLNTDKRSWNMSQIRDKDSKPELLVRSYLHGRGFRFRTNVKSLPGRPDIVLKKYNAIYWVSNTDVELRNVKVYCWWVGGQLKCTAQETAEVSKNLL